MMEKWRLLHRLQLSPSQWAAHLPDPRKVDLVDQVDNLGFDHTTSKE